MQTLKKLLLIVLVPILGLSMFLSIVTLAINSYVKPTNIKSTLSESKIYDAITPAIVEELQKNASNPQPEESNDIPLDRPEIQAIIIKAIPPDFWQNAAEDVVDGSFAWLESDSKAIVFEVDTQKPKENLLNLVADYVITRTEALPTCTSPDQVPNPDDLFNLACKPPDFNAQNAKQEFLAQADSSEFLGENKVFTAKDLSGEKGTTIEEQLQPVKSGYQLSRSLPLIFILSVIVLTVMVFLLHSDRRKAINRLRTLYISSGVGILIFSGFIWLMFKKVTTPNIKLDNFASPELGNSALYIANDAFDAVFKVLFLGGIVYLVIGGMFWLVRYKLYGKLTKEQKDENVKEFYDEHDKTKAKEHLEDSSVSNPEDKKPLKDENTAK